MEKWAIRSQSGYTESKTFSIKSQDTLASYSFLSHTDVPGSNFVKQSEETSGWHIMCVCVCVSLSVTERRREEVVKDTVALIYVPMER